MSHPGHARAVIFDARDHSLQHATIPVPPLAEGEMIVANEFVTLCRSDINTFSGKRSEKNPTILGHEIVGRIAARHPEAPSHDILGAPLSIGDRITWGIYASNPGSMLAQRGIPQKGDNLFKYGHEEIREGHTLHGGLSSHTIIRRHTPVARLTEGMPLPVAATINCAVATVAGALRLAGPMAGMRVFVFGAGMLGVVACAMARSSGAASVAATDTNEDRMRIALLFGADRMVAPEDVLAPEPARKTGLHDIVFDFSGAPDSMEASLRILAIGGTTVWVGATFPQRDVPVSAERLIRNIHTIKGLHNYNGSDLADAVAFMEAHHAAYPFIDLIDGRFTLERTSEAFACAIEDNPFRVGIAIR
jgi:alcohol dehydrogenase